MSVALIALIFVLAFGVTLSRGGVIAFVTVYLPALLLFNLVRPIELPGVTDLTADIAAVYGILLGSLPRLGQPLPIKFNLLDALVLAMVVSKIITALGTATYYTGVSMASSGLVTILVPYVLARLAVRSPEARRIALGVIVGCALAFGVMAVIEARLWPYLFSRLMVSAGLSGDYGDMVYHRYGFFRARLLFRHPIDLGNVAVEMFGLLLFLAGTIPGALRRPSVQLAGIALVGCTLASISFTGFVALATTGALVLVLRVAFVRRLVAVLPILWVVGGLALAAVLMQVDVNYDKSGGLAESSFMTRALIMQNGSKVAAQAGAFGRGDTVTRSELNLDSVDNSYLLAMIQYGWVYLGLMIALPLVLCRYAAHAFRTPQGRAAPFPLAALIATLLGIMAGMYTVWFGFTYAVVFYLILAMANTTTQLYRGQVSIAPQTAAQAHGAGRLPALGARP